jgi:predicted nuclease with TOPRIM domain
MSSLKRRLSVGYTPPWKTSFNRAPVTPPVRIERLAKMCDDMTTKLNDCNRKTDVYIHGARSLNKQLSEQQRANTIQQQHVERLTQQNTLLQQHVERLTQQNTLQQHQIARNQEEIVLLSKLGPRLQDCETQLKIRRANDLARLASRLTLG